MFVYTARNATILMQVVVLTARCKVFIKFGESVDFIKLHEVSEDLI